MNSVQMTIMFKTPGEKEGVDNDDAPIEAILKMNEMIKALTNKLHCKIRPCKNIKSWKSNYHPDYSDILTELQKGIDFVESYVFDNNRFIDYGRQDMSECKNFILRLLDYAKIVIVDVI